LNAGRSGARLQAPLMFTKSWRWTLAVSALLLLVGGPLHPKADPRRSFNESTALMLADSHWPVSHALMLCSYILLVFALVGMAARPGTPARARHILQIAQIGAGLSVLEMAFHLAAIVDRPALLAGGPTPVFTTHLRLAAVAYPVLGLSMAALAWEGASKRWLGAPAIAWVGVIGGVTHGVSAPIVVLTRDQHYSWLFMGAALLAAWMLLAAVWPAPIRPASAVAN